eukprot:15452761-Alexandrium_andersonii.AAC.1
MRQMRAAAHKDGWMSTGARLLGRELGSVSFQLASVLATSGQGTSMCSRCCLRPEGCDDR